MEKVFLVFDRIIDLTSEKNYAYMAIVKKAEIRSGKPTVEGTRVTVGDIAERFYRLGRGLSDIASDLGIEESEAEEALRYHKSSTAEGVTA